MSQDRLLYFLIWSCSPSYLTLSCPTSCSVVLTGVIFLPSSSLLYWAGTFSLPFCLAQPSMAFARVQGEPERPLVPGVEKEKVKKHLEAGWSQGRLESGAKLNCMFHPSFGSRRCLVNVLYGHYKCLYFVACYTVISTTSTFQFPWYLQKCTFWRKRAPVRCCRLWHCHHLARGSPLCSTKGRRYCYRTAPSWLHTALCFKTVWKNNPEKLQGRPGNKLNEIVPLGQRVLSSVSPVQV